MAETETTDGPVVAIDTIEEFIKACYPAPRLLPSLTAGAPNESAPPLTLGCMARAGGDEAPAFPSDDPAGLKSAAAMQVEAGQPVSVFADMAKERPAFQPGDVVILKSGGPRMTVDAAGDEQCECAWFNDSGSFERNTFAIASLRAVNGS